MNRINFKKTVEKLGYRTPDVFKKNVRIKIDKNRIHVKIGNHARTKKDH